MKTFTRDAVRRAQVALVVAVVGASVLTALPASAAYQCNDGGPMSGHRCNELVALTTGGQAAGTIHGSITADGNHVAFSTTSGAIPGGASGQHAYVRELGTSNHVLASRATTTAGAAGNGPSYEPVASEDGNVVAFLSKATNLIGLDGNGDVADVFVRNIAANTTTHISVATNPLTGANSPATQVAISADGSTVAFTSEASNLVSGDTNGAYDVFVANADGSDLMRASTTSSGAQANGNSGRPALSADGRYLAFMSEASNLVAGDTNGKMDVFVKDLDTGTVERVSVGDGGAEANDRSGNGGLSISVDANLVAFTTDATNLLPGDVNGVSDIAVYNRTASTTTLVGYQAPSDPSSFPWISGDGTVVLFNRGPVSGDQRLFVGGVAPTTGLMRLEATYNGATGATTPFATGSLPFGRGISGDGTVALFHVETGLLAEDTNGDTDLYVHIADLRGPSIGATPAVTNNPLFPITGTLQGRGNAVEVRDDSNVVIGFQQTVAPSNAVSLSTSALADGGHTLEVRELAPPYASDAVVRDVIVDTVAPSALAITNPGHGGTIGDPNLHISGTAGTAVGDDATVNVTVLDDSNAQIGSLSAPVAGDGSWSVTGPTLGANGDYSVEATQADHAGNSSFASSSFTLDAGVPTVSITSPLPGLYNVATHTVGGTVSGATEVTLLINGDDELVAPSGTTWSVSKSFPDGTYALEAEAMNLAGTGTSGTVVVSIDTLAPTAPTIDSPVHASTITTASPLIEGIAEPGATIRLTIDGVAVNPAPVADGAGDWSHQAVSLAEGTRALVARAEDAAGNLSGPTTIAFSIDTVAPNAPVILNPAAGSTISSTTVIVSGVGEPGATVTVFESPAVIGTAAVPASGFWQISVTFAVGPHSLHAIQTDGVGQDSAPSSTVTFTIDPDSPSATTLDTPLHNSVIASRNVVAAGKAEPSGSVQVYLVDGMSESPIGDAASVDTHGNWVQTIRLNDGVYTIRARETTTNSVTGERTFTVRSGVPVITSPVSGAIVGSHFTVSGTALPDATVTLRDGSTTLGTTTAGSGGHWSMGIWRPDGTRTLIAHAGSGASKTEDSDPRLVTVDSVGPTVTANADGDIMGNLIDAPVGISGTAVDPAKVALINIVYTNLIGQVVVSSSVECTGCFDETSVTYSDSPSLTPGRWTASVRGVDVLGNASPPVSVSFIVAV